ncbi:TPA: long polar fimbrial protein LpfD [Enterobacter asburiae]|nr:long polar fimbrial protein LpfD [Enterobacter asburiae]
MNKKTVILGGLLGVVIALFSGNALAASDWGPCEPVGATHRYSALIDQTVTDASMNTTGREIPDFFSWDLGVSYQATCECPDNNSSQVTWFKAISPLPAGHQSDGKQFYQINSHLEAKIDVFVEGNTLKYFTVPFTESNTLDNRAGCDVKPSSQIFYSGSKGKLSLYIAHPFVGSLTIPETIIADVYASKKQSVFGASPISEVTLSGQIDVPQGCEMPAGAILDIPLGEFQSHDFKDRTGQMPDGATKIRKTLTFDCLNISDGVKIYISLEGNVNTNNPNAVDLGNPDIGAIVEGANNNILIPNDNTSLEELSVGPLVDNSRSATATIYAYPISTTGLMPAAGDYSGIATMRIQVE